MDEIEYLLDKRDRIAQAIADNGGIVLNHLGYEIKKMEKICKNCIHWVNFGLGFWGQCGILSTEQMDTDTCEDFTPLSNPSTNQPGLNQQNSLYDRAKDLGMQEISEEEQRAARQSISGVISFEPVE